MVDPKLPHREYTFRTQFKDRKRPHHIVTIAATNDLDAMKDWCRLNSVQDMSQDEVDRTVITSAAVDRRWP